MLSRTADNLYWLARYVERAENMARILDVSHRMSQLPSGRNGADSASEWLPALIIAGQRPLYEGQHDTITAGAVIAFMALNPDNPSSIYSSLRQARENARAERNAIPSEMFECINSAWLEIKDMHYANLVDSGFRDFFDWVKDRSALFRGTTVGTMLQNEAFYFARLGTFIERADNTARLLDVKYHVLAPEEDRIDEAVDYYQWGALLRSLSAFKAYRLIYRDNIKPRNVAELLILRDEFPRSLHACYDVVYQQLQMLGPKLECTRQAGEMHAKLHFNRTQDITRRGLHRFLTDFINRNSGISAEIARDFLLVA